MNAHEPFDSWLPFYAAGTLDEAGRAEMQAHLAACPQCREDLALWAGVSTEISRTSRAARVSPEVAERALEQVRRSNQADGLGRLTNGLRLGWLLLRSQAVLVQRELWPASAVVMVMGVAVALLVQKAGVVYFLAPLVAAASLAVIYGPEHDPGSELALATPTSPWMILLARMTLVSGYNLLLALAASAALLAILPAELLGGLILAWLGPMTFLSALALLLSLWIGTGNAVLLSYGLWLLQYQPLQLSPVWASVLGNYQDFWRSTPLLLILSLALAAAALISATRRPQMLPQRPA